MEAQVALVTAAAGAGIGQAIARRLARAGACVVISDLHERRTRETAEAMSREFGREFVGRTLDVTDPAAARAVVDWTVERYGRIDILVNNAGFNKPQSVWEMDVENWRRVLDVCLNGTFYAIRAALPHMIRRGAGAIVNIASMVGWNALGADGQAHYIAAKAGVMGLTRAVAAEVAPHGIRCNAVAPGFVPNPFVEKMYSLEHIERRRQAIPLGRVGHPDDVADVVYFLASDQARYVTGEVICVSGGLYMPA